MYVSLIAAHRLLEWMNPLRQSAGRAQLCGPDRQVIRYPASIAAWAFAAASAPVSPPNMTSCKAVRSASVTTAG